MQVARSVLNAIGRTPLVRLRKIVPAGFARVLVKLEGANPTGSMKDRWAQAVIERAAADGRLPPEGKVVEYSGGSTGTSLAMVSGAKGYRIRIVTSDAFSQEKRDHMEALGADLILVPSEGGLSTQELFKEMIRTAEELSKEPKTFFSDQLNNPDGVAGYHSMGEEIWDQTGGNVDAFVQSVGTGHSLRGVTEALRRHKSDVLTVAVEPGESAVLSGGESGAHDIEGIGIGYDPPTWDPELVDGIESVTTAEAKAMARRLAREEALFAGTSSGANVVAALRVAERLGSKANVATLLVDSGMKYLSTDLYRGD
jgi:cysteine synthase A